MIHGSEIRMASLPGEEEKHVEFVRRLVDETNRAIDDYNRGLAEAEARDHSRRKRQDAEVEQIRERLKKIHIA